MSCLQQPAREQPDTPPAPPAAAAAAAVDWLNLFEKVDGKAELEVEDVDEDEEEEKLGLEVGGGTT